MGIDLGLSNFVIYREGHRILGFTAKMPPIEALDRPPFLKSIDKLLDFLFSDLSGKILCFTPVSLTSHYQRLPGHVPPQAYAMAYIGAWITDRIFGF
jgi:hypothetical protein